MKTKSSIACAFGVMFTHASAALYQAPFSTTDVQANAHGDVFANYPEWSLEAMQTTEDHLYEARVQIPGELEVSNLVNGDPYDVGYDVRNTVTSYVSSSLIGAGDAFNLSAGALNVKVDAGSRFTSDVVGNFNIGVVIGLVHFTFHPGYEGGALRIEKAEYDFGYYLFNTNMGYTPGIGDDFTAVDITAVENGSNYDFAYTIGSYSGAITLTKEQVDDSPEGISSIGLRVNGYPSTANFRDFEVTYAVPEPSLGIMAALPGLAILRRRRA